MAFLSHHKLSNAGFFHIGKNVCISDRASFYGVDRISIGDGTRIDDFCVISAGEGGIELEGNVHIAVFSSLIGAGKILIGEFSNISSRVSIYTSSDDYSGHTMTNPTVPDRFKDVFHAPVSIGRHVIIGSGSVVLPGCVIPDGAAIGALSLINSNLQPWTIYAGIPATAIRERSRNALALHAELEAQRNGDKSANKTNDQQ